MYRNKIVGWKSDFEKAVLMPSSQDTEESCQQFFIRNFFITQCALQVNRRNANYINDINQVPRPTSSSKWVGEPDYKDVNLVLSDLHKICSVLWSKISCLEFCNQ